VSDPNSTTITIPAVRHGEHIELHVTEGDVEWAFYGAATRCGLSHDIASAAAALTAAIQKVRASAEG
jgi:hypothetical protein